jgi:hypothetical protein
MNTLILMCVALPLAATRLQPLGAPLVLGLAAALAFYGFRYGVFLATIAGLHALAAVMAALGLAGPVGAWLELADVPRSFVEGIAFAVASRNASISAGADLPSA